jgi:hypothetical protein
MSGAESRIPNLSDAKELQNVFAKVSGRRPNVFGCDSCEPLGSALSDGPVAAILGTGG